VSRRSLAIAISVIIGVGNWVRQISGSKKLSNICDLSRQRVVYAR